MKRHKIQACSLFLLIFSGVQTTVYAQAEEQETPAVKAIEPLTVRFEDDGDDIVLFTEDELHHEEEVVQEQLLNRPWYAGVVDLLQRFAGKLSSPFFLLWYKWNTWKNKQASL
jgi:hypothetical protein